MPSIAHVIGAALLLAASALASAASATTIQASGMLDLIVLDGGSSQFSGAPLGTSIAMSFEYAQACPGVCIEDPPEADEANFQFPGFSSSLTFGASQFSGPTRVNVQNDHALDAGEAALVSQILGAAIAAGTLVDVWTVGGSDGSISFELNLLSFDTALFSDLSFQGLPPAAAAVDAVVLQVLDDDGASYHGIAGAVGVVVPEPRVAVLVLGSVLALACFGRRAAR